MVMAMLLLSACSMVTLGYNNADVYLRHTVNGYAEFNEAQKIAIRQEVNTFMLDNRKNMLPLYIDYLNHVKQLIQAGASRKKVEVTRLRETVRELYVLSLQPAIKPAAAFLASIDTAQIDQLVTSFAKENTRQQENELSGSTEQRLLRRAEKTVEFVENLTGSLTDKQQEKVRALSSKMPFAGEVYLNQRAANQARLIALLRQHKAEPNKAEPEIATMLEKWLKTPELYRSTDEHKLMLSFESAADDMIMGVVEILSEAQQQKLLDSIQKYITVFQELTQH